MKDLNIIASVFVFGDVSKTKNIDKFFSIDGKTLLDYVASRDTLNEEVVSGLIRQLVVILHHMHSNNILHLDLRVSMEAIIYKLLRL